MTGREDRRLSQLRFDSAQRAMAGRSSSQQPVLGLEPPGIGAVGHLGRGGSYTESGPPPRKPEKPWVGVGRSPGPDAVLCLLVKSGSSDHVPPFLCTTNYILQSCQRQNQPEASESGTCQWMKCWLRGRSQTAVLGGGEGRRGQVCCFSFCSMATWE